MIFKTVDFYKRLSHPRIIAAVTQTRNRNVHLLGTLNYQFRKLDHRGMNGIYFVQLHTFCGTMYKVKDIIEHRCQPLNVFPVERRDESKSYFLENTVSDFIA